MKRRLKNIDDEFEISFLEGVLERRPGFKEALQALGDLYTRNGYYEEGLKADLRLKDLCPNNAMILYNLACSQSLLGDVDSALNSIKAAVDAGYKDFRYMARDDDLENLHQDPRFQRYFSQVSGELWSNMI